MFRFCCESFFHHWFEVVVESAQHFLPAFFPFRNFIELLLHVSREVVVHDSREILVQEIIDNHADICRQKL